MLLPELLCAVEEQQMGVHMWGNCKVGCHFCPQLVV